MKKITFLSENKREKEFTITLKKRVNEYFRKNDLSKKGNVRMYFKTVCMLSLYLAPFVILLTVEIANRNFIGATCRNFRESTDMTAHFED